MEIGNNIVLLSSSSKHILLLDVFYLNFSINLFNIIIRYDVTNDLNFVYQKIIYSWN